MHCHYVRYRLLYTNYVISALNCHHLKVLELDHARGVTQDHALTVCKHGLKGT